MKEAALSQYSGIDRTKPRANTLSWKPPATNMFMYGLRASAAATLVVVGDLLALLMAVLIPAAPVHAQGNAPVVWVDNRVSLQGRRISSVADVVNDSLQHIPGETLADVRNTLERALRAKGVVLDPSSGSSIPGTLQARTTLMAFKTGDSHGRWLGFGAGAARCSIRIQLLEVESTRVVADVVHTRVVDTGGFFTLFADSSIHRDVTAELADIVARILHRGS